MSGTHERMRTHAGDERDVALGRTHRHEVLHRHARAHGGGARFGYLNHGDAPRDERWFGCALGLQGAGCLTNKGERGGVERRGERMNLGKIKIPSFFPPPCSEESSKEPSGFSKSRSAISRVRALLAARSRPAPSRLRPLDVPRRAFPRDERGSCGGTIVKGVRTL